MAHRIYGTAEAFGLTATKKSTEVYRLWGAAVKNDVCGESIDHFGAIAVRSLEKDGEVTYPGMGEIVNLELDRGDLLTGLVGRFRDDDAEAPTTKVSIRD